ncbi:MAG: 4-alpha-glucanotransferase, partial [Gemmatimonadota bacterium]
MDELRALRSLARAMGVHTRYTDGLGRHVLVSPETLLRVCAALGAPVASLADAADALRALDAGGSIDLVPPVLVAWDGVLPPLEIVADGPIHAELRLEDGAVVPLETSSLPFGYHQLTVEADGRREQCTIIAAPVEAWRRPDSPRSWGVGAHLAALRSARSRSLGDLRDLESLCRWVRERGGDLVTVLPLLPTFNSGPPEPSPYSPVSRLFWSELILDLG